MIGFDWQPTMRSYIFKQRMGQRAKRKEQGAERRAKRAQHGTGLREICKASSRCMGT